MTKVLAVAPCFDEAGRVGRVVAAMPAQVTQVLVVDDGSTDGSVREARDAGARVLQQPRRSGVGAALRSGFQVARDEGFDVVVVLAANSKDDPAEIPKLLEPIASGRADFVQGSRWLERSREFGAMPRYRRLATRVHPLLFTLATGRFVTESTNGFRALTTRLLSDPQLGLEDPALDGYQLEPWLYAHALRLGYRAVEVPVRKVYPSSGPTTKIPPVTGWLQLLTPLVRERLHAPR